MLGALNLWSSTSSSFQIITTLIQNTGLYILKKHWLPKEYCNTYYIIKTRYFLVDRELNLTDSQQNSQASLALLLVKPCITVSLNYNPPACSRSALKKSVFSASRSIEKKRIYWIRKGIVNNFNSPLLDLKRSPPAILCFEKMRRTLCHR